MARSPKMLTEFDGVFNKLIAARMKALGQERLEEFVAYSRIPYSTLYNLVVGRLSPSGTYVKPSVDTLTLLARALDEPLARLVYDLVPDAPGADEPNCDDHPVRHLKVQVAGWVGAGPELGEEITDSWIAVDYQFARGRALRAFKVRGDSMSAGRRPIYDGDIVVVDADDKGYNAAAVVARLDDDRHVCKLLKDDKFGRLLISANPTHTNGTPAIIPVDGTEIIGRVVMTIGKDDTTPNGP